MTHTLLQLVVLFGSGALIAMIFHHLRIPSLVGFIAAGALVGPHGIGLLTGGSEVAFLSELGMVFLMFSIGAEFSWARMKSMRRTFLGWGTIQVVGTTLLATALLTTTLQMPVPKALAIAFMISMSSTAIVLGLLTNARQLETVHGNALVGVLLFQDLAFIPMVLVMPLLSTSLNGSSSWAMPSILGGSVAKIAMVAFLVWFGGRLAIPQLFDRIVRTRSREAFYFLVLFLCFGMALLFEWWGFSVSLGAFVAGVLISESPYGKQAVAEVIPLRDNFLALFFVSVGMLLDFDFLLSHPTPVLTIVLAILALKTLVAGGAGWVLGYSGPISLLTGLMLAQVGEFSFILADEARQGALLTESEFQYFLTTAVLTMLATPWINRFLPQRLLTRTFAGLTAAPTSPDLRPAAAGSTSASKSRTLIIGFGVVGQDVCSALDSLKIPSTIIEMNASNLKRSQASATSRFVFGDGSRDEVLEEAGIEAARLVVITVSGSYYTQAILNAVRRKRPDVHVIVRTQYLREAQALQTSREVDLVVAEYETSLEVMARALKVYGVSSDRVHEFLVRSRNTFSGSLAGIRDSLRRTIELPTWEALSTLRPMTVAPGGAAADQSLAQLNLRQRTGALIVSVYREGLGTKIPTSDFVLNAGDVVHCVGSSVALDQAAALLGPLPATTQSAVQLPS